MFRKALIVLLIILVLSAVWYFFMKPADYLASFKTQATSGTVKQSLRIWEKSLQRSKILRQHQLTGFEHQVIFNDSIFNFKWEIKKANDSVSKIYTRISNQESSLKQRLYMLFSETDFEKRSKKTVLEFYEDLTDHLDHFKVTYKGLDSISSTFCAYIPIKDIQLKKASRMMEYYPILDNFALDSRIKTNGLPFIEVIEWNKETDSISFNFCYPIANTGSLPSHELIKYKDFKGRKALRATYNGNYITSDRAWYTLMERAKKENIAIIEKPIEIFFTNPNVGGNELEWIAEIYMPLE